MHNSSSMPYIDRNSRRRHYSRSPYDDVELSKHFKSSNTNDYSYGSGSDSSRLYTSICVKNINPKLSDLEIRDLCTKKFSKYGSHSIKIYHRNHERVAFVNFTNCEDARKARYAKTDLVWKNMEVRLEPVYYRKTVPAEQPINPENQRERSPLNLRRRRRSRSNSSSSRINVRNQSNRRSPIRQQRPISPPYSSPVPPPPPPPRSSRRRYSPYIPLPPDLMDYTNKTSSRQRQRSSSSPPTQSHHQKKTLKQHRDRNSNSNKSISPSPQRRTNSDDESTISNEATRTLLIENLERDITVSKLNEIFGRFGAINHIDLKNATSSSKRPYAFIQYENMNMAYDARRAMNGQSIGKSDCKIGYGKIVPTKYLWVGNIPVNIKRRDLEHAFSRYGQIKSFDYSMGDPTAIITYFDIEDAVKARSKLVGTIEINDGRVIRCESNSLRRGFCIDYLDRPTSRRFVVVRPREKSSSYSRHSSLIKDRSPSQENDINNDEQQIENFKTETHSRSPTPPITNTIKQRRSTDSSHNSFVNNSSIAGRTFYGPLGSYLLPEHTINIDNINDLMIRCEQLNALATKNSTALSTVYPVQFILKSHAYDARLHFLAGSPTLASLLLGQPGDLIAAKTELKITQRLRLDQYKLEDLENKLRTNVINALSMSGNQSHINSNDHLSNGSTSLINRKQITVANQTKFSILIASSKIYDANDLIKQQTSNEQIKSENLSPRLTNQINENMEIKKETSENQDDDDDDDDDDESSLSHLISYLNEKDAAGIITIPFHPTYYNDHSSRQEIAVLHIFPSCPFTKKILKLIFSSIDFSNQLTTKINDQHLMVVIVHND